MCRKLFTEEQDEFIRENYKGLYNKELTELANHKFGTSFSVGQVKSYKNRNKLDSGLRTHFQKGQTPFNKGMKQEEYMSEEAIERTKKTRFGEGHKPANWKPIGHERVTKDGYIEIKVRDLDGVHSVKNFELKHRYVWEKQHGNIPKNHVLLFKNGDALDIRLDNLMLIDRSVLLHMNKQELISEYPGLNEAAANLVKLHLKTIGFEQV